MAVPDYTKKQIARYLAPGANPNTAPLDFRNLGEFEKGWEAFKDETVGIGGGALALGAQQLKKVLPAGADPFLNKIVESGLNTYKEKTAESVAGAQAPAVAAIEDIKGVGDLGDWAAYQAGKGLPQLAGFGLGGVVGKQVAKLGVKKGLKHVLETEVGKKVRGGVGEAVTKEMKDEAADQVRKILTRGTVAGGVGLATPYEAGAAFGQMTGDGLTPEQAANEAVAVGGVNAALEFLPIYEVFKKVGVGDFAKDGIREIFKGDKALGKAVVELARRASGAAATGATAEGVTEGLQELTNIAATRWAKDQEIFSGLSDDEWSAVLNAGAAGGLLGGGVAGAGGMFIGPQGGEAGTDTGTTPPRTPKAGPRPAPAKPGEPFVGPPAPGPEPFVGPVEPVGPPRPPAEPGPEPFVGPVEPVGPPRPPAEVTPTEPTPAEPGEFVGPPPELVGPQYPEEERRKNDAVRKSVDDMSPEDQAAAIKYLREERALSQATGISNKLAWKERTVKPFMAAIDVDSLKWINDNLGHEEGDQLLKVVAQSLQDHTGDAYHFSGDEFWVQADTAEELYNMLDAAQAALQEEDVGGYPPSFSYGIGTDIESAEGAMMADKAAREKAGLRAARGEAPPTKVAPAPVEATPVEPAPVTLPNREQGLKQGWKPSGAQQYAERYGAVYGEQDPLSSPAGVDRIEAANRTLPEQVARTDPNLARQLANEIRKMPGQFGAWSGMHPDYANKVANDLERAAVRAEEAGDYFVYPAEDEQVNFGEVSTNSKGQPFKSRRAAANAATKLGMNNVEIDERTTPEGTTQFVIRDLGELESAADTSKAPIPEMLGDVQMPVNMVEAETIPPSTKIKLTRQRGEEAVTKEVNAKQAATRARRRLEACRKMIECLSR